MNYRIIKEQIVHITHNDADALGCALVVDMYRKHMVYDGSERGYIPVHNFLAVTSAQETIKFIIDMLNLIYNASKTGIDNLDIDEKDIDRFEYIMSGYKYIHNDTIFREGDKVLQTKNINDLEISNGDIGIIDSITKTKDGILAVINFDGIIVEFSKKHFDDLKLGYAISIHKSQGSEFEIVIMPMDLSFKRMLYRKLLYTGVTRAKKSLTLVGEKSAFVYATSKLEGESRNTLLCDLLKSSINF